MSEAASSTPVLPSIEVRFKREATILLPLREPHLKFIGMTDIDDPLARNLGSHRDGRGISVEFEMGHGMRIRGENEFASLINGEPGEVGVEVLAARESVDLDRHAGIGAGRKNGLPPSLEPGTLMEVPAPWVGEDMHLGSADGSQESFGLITVRIKLTVDGGDHAVDLEALTFGDVEGAVDEDLDLEPLEEPVILAVLIVPPLDSPALKTDAISVEPRCNLEAA